MYFYNVSELTDFYNKHVKDFKIKGPFIRISKSMNDILDASKNYNCITCAAHPYGYMWKNLEKVTRSDAELLVKFDCIEVLNGEMTREKNIKALHLAAHKRMPYIGGSDGHVIFNLGNVVTYSTAKDIDGFLSDIKNQRNYVTGTMTGKLHALTTHSPGMRRHLAANMPSFTDKFKNSVDFLKPKIQQKFDKFREKVRRKQINRLIDNMKNKI